MKTLASLLILASCLTLCRAEEPQYVAAYDLAARNKRPLVVGVGCFPPAGEWVVTSVGRLTGYKGPCVVVGSWDGLYVATLPSGATAKDIKSVLGAARGHKGSGEVFPAAAPSTLPKKFNPDTQRNFQEEMNRRRVSVIRSSGGSC